MRAPSALLVGLVACGPKIPAPPADLGTLPPIERSDLPAITVRGMVVATTRMSPHLAVAGADKAEQRAPIWVFVLEHPTRGTILVDAGYGRRTLADPRDLPGGLSQRIFDLEMRVPAADALARLPSIEPVQHVVLTHLHHDHVAGVEDFPDATLWASDADWSWGAKRRALRGVDPVPYAGRDASHPAYDDGPIGPFPAHEDLFGDRSILLVPAPGHTPGSQLVWVNTPEHTWLFIGDVSWIDAGLDGPRPKNGLVRGFVETDWRANLEMLHRVRTLRGRDDLTIVCGHEPADPDRYPAWPEPWGPP